MSNFPLAMCRPVTEQLLAFFSEKPTCDGNEMIVLLEDSAAIGQAVQRHKLHQAIKEVDKDYFRNASLMRGQFAHGTVIFDARRFNVSPRAPFKLVVFVGDTKLLFVFQ